MSPQITSRIIHKNNDRKEHYARKKMKLKPSMMIPSLFSNKISENGTISKYKPDKTETGFSLSPSKMIFFKSSLLEFGVSSSHQGEYLKWLRFYHHFCRKYNHHIESENSLGPFLAKLESKNNSKGNIIMAKKAVELFLNLLHTITVKMM